MIGRRASQMAPVSWNVGLHGESSRFGLETDCRADASPWKDAKLCLETVNRSTSIPFIWDAKARDNFRSPDRTPGQSSNFPPPHG